MYCPPWGTIPQVSDTSRLLFIVYPTPAHLSISTIKNGFAVGDPQVSHRVQKRKSAANSGGNPVDSTQSPRFADAFSVKSIHRFTKKRNRNKTFPEAELLTEKFALTKSRKSASRFPHRKKTLNEIKSRFVTSANRLPNACRGATRWLCW